MHNLHYRRVTIATFVQSWPVALHYLYSLVLTPAAQVVEHACTVARTCNSCCAGNHNDEELLLPSASYNTNIHAHIIHQHALIAAWSLRLCACCMFGDTFWHHKLWMACAQVTRCVWLCMASRCGWCITFTSCTHLHSADLREGQLHITMEFRHIVNAVCCPSPMRNHRPCV